jgi:signal transduction histidine kinase
MYRIAQEAVRNAVRHAQARHIRIQLTDTSGTLRLRVVDDGVGIGRASDAGGGYGLRSMAYRAALIGATFECRPAQDGGTAMICTVARKLSSGD